MYLQLIALISATFSHLCSDVFAHGSQCRSLTGTPSYGAKEVSWQGCLYNLHARTGLHAFTLEVCGVQGSIMQEALFVGLLEACICFSMLVLLSESRAGPLPAACFNPRVVP